MGMTKESWITRRKNGNSSPWNKGLTKDSHPSIKRYGELHSKHMTGKKHSLEHNKNISTSLKKTLDGKQWNSGLTKADHPRIASMALKQRENSWRYKTPEYRAKLSKIAKEKGFGKWMIDKPQQCKIFKDSSIERAMEAEFIKRGMQYKKQVPLHRVACVDFLLGDKTIVQCDGEYWHNLPERKEKDIRQDKILKSMGYKIYRFWESEIKNDVSKCVSSIK